MNRTFCFLLNEFRNFAFEPKISLLMSTVDDLTTCWLEVAVAHFLFHS